MPRLDAYPNTLETTGIAADAAVTIGKVTPMFERQRPTSVSDLPLDWVGGASDAGTLLARIAPTQRDMARLRRAHELVGALFGPDRRRVWLTTRLPDREETPLEYLAVHGPDGWGELLRGLLGAMQGGSYASEADRDWATERLAGHRLIIRRSKLT